MKDFFIKKKIEIKPVVFIFLSFLFVILIGSIFLYLPISINEGIKVSYFDSLFMSTSATCVTGLIGIKESIVDTYSLFGKIILIILVQIGGLGAATIAMSFILIAASSLSYSQQVLVKESWNISSFKGLKKIFVLNLLITFIVEFIGSILIFIDLICFHKEIGNVGSLIGNSIFLSISSFNNAGFDLFGNSSLINFSNDYFLLFIESLLIILGGMGYLVIIDIMTKKFKFKKFNLQTKVVLTINLFLIIFGALLLYISENITYFIYKSDKGMDFISSLFLSISSRTAGITTYKISELKGSSIVLLNLFMFIGANPGSTGGGIKVTTIFIILLSIKSEIDGKRVQVFKRTIDKDTIRKSYFLMNISVIILILSFILMYLFESNNFSNSLYYALEIFGAFSTCGLTYGITYGLSLWSKILLIILMVIGRIGPMSISLTFIKKKKNQKWKYISESLPIG